MVELQEYNKYSSDDPLSQNTLILIVSQETDNDPKQHWMINEDIPKEKQAMCYRQSHLILLGFFFFSIFFT